MTDDEAQVTDEAEPADGAQVTDDAEPADEAQVTDEAQTADEAQVTDEAQTAEEQLRQGLEQLNQAIKMPSLVEDPEWRKRFDRALEASEAAIAGR
ncbi:MAG: hypothetical protein M3P12_03120 [Gemmatimonadota bacterium]|nr:hypothetical protein [Gemmatimonadota bacterium]